MLLPLRTAAVRRDRTLRALATAVALGLVAAATSGCMFGQSTGFGTPQAPKVLRDSRGGGFDYGPRPTVRGEETQASFEARVDRHYYARYEALLADLDAAQGPESRRVALAAVERHRDRVLFDILTEIDDSYFKFEKQLTVGQSASNLIWDWIDLGLDATAAAMTPVSTKTILSTIATGVEGARLSIDKNVFRGQVYDLINLSMRGERQAVLNEIYLRLEGDRASAGFDYPLEEVVRDLARYYYAGAVTSALTRMHRLASEDLDRLEREGVAIRTGEAAREEAALRAEEAARADQRAALEAARSSALEGLRSVLERLEQLDRRTDS